MDFPLSSILCVMITTLIVATLFTFFRCPREGCTKMFFSSVSMGSHVRNHDVSKSFVCPYENCGREFTQQCKLTAHERYSCVSFGILGNIGRAELYSLQLSSFTV